MSLFTNSISWPWKTRLALHLRHDNYLLYCDIPTPHIFRLGMYTRELKLTPVFRNRAELTKYLLDNCPYPTNMNYRPVSVGTAREAGLEIKNPCVFIVPDKKGMPKYVKQTLSDIEDIRQAAR